jgi:anaerobic selenocysteine-containing dehydrogenase
MVAEVGDDGLVAALRPDREHPVSRGFACHKGLSYIDVHHDPDRLNHPMRRVSSAEGEPTFERIGWDDALSEIGSRLRAIRDTYGPDAISGYGGNPIAFNSKAFAPAFSLVARMGGRRSFNAGTQDMVNKVAATEAIFGSYFFPVPDFYRTNYLLCLGTNPRVSNWTTLSTHRPMHLVQDITSRGGKVRYVNPRRIESEGRGTGDVILIRPDTDVYFLAALLHEIQARGGFRTDVIAKRGKNIEPLQAFISRYAPDRVAAVTGIEADTIRTVAREFMEADGAATHLSTGVNQGRQGTLASWLVHMLSFVTANLGREGGEYYAKGWFDSVAPAAESEVYETPLGAMRDIFGALPGTLLADFIELDDNPIRALIVTSGNPLLSMGGEERLRRALPKLELIVCIDIYQNATGDYAHYLLPAADWLEREDTNAVASGVQPIPYVQFTEAIVSPRFQRRDDWWIVGRLEQELGLPSHLDGDAPDPLATDKALLAQAGLSLEELRKAPHGTILLPQNPREAFFSDVVRTADGKVDCCPASFADALERCEEIFAGLAEEDAAQLKLISLRTIHMHNGLLANVKALDRRNASPNPLHIHPADADRRGLGEGDLARVSNAYGELVTPITRDETLLPGVVALSHGYGHVEASGMRNARSNPGVNVNRLMPTGPGSYEQLSNMSHMNGVAVEVARV